MFDTNTAAGVKHTTGCLRLSQRAEQLPPKQGCRFDSCDLNNNPFHQRWSLSAVPVSVIGGELSAVKERLKSQLQKNSGQNSRRGQRNASSLFVFLFFNIFIYFTFPY